MKKIIILSALLFAPFTVSAAPKVSSLKICVNLVSQQIIARARCKKGFSELNLSALQTLSAPVVGPQGPKGDQGLPGVPGSLDLVVSTKTASVLPAAFQFDLGMGIPPLVTPGTLQVVAECPPKHFVAGFLCAASAALPGGVSQNGGGPNVGGNAAQCFWFNSTFVPINLDFKATAFCAPAP